MFFQRSAKEVKGVVEREKLGGISRLSARGKNK
jgi:hypothetical protein